MVTTLSPRPISAESAPSAAQVVTSVPAQLNFALPPLGTVFGELTTVTRGWSTLTLHWLGALVPHTTPSANVLASVETVTLAEPLGAPLVSKPVARLVEPGEHAQFTLTVDPFKTVADPQVNDCTVAGA